MTVRDVARYLLRIAISTTPAFDAPVMGFPSEYRHHVWYGKTKMVRLSDGEKKLKICLFVLTEYTNVTDGQTDGQRHRMTAYRHSISSRGKNVHANTELCAWLSLRTLRVLRCARCIGSNVQYCSRFCHIVKYINVLFWHRIAL